MGSTLARPAGNLRTSLRFPCGHLEAERSVGRRTRATARAAWVACRRCNLIAVTVARVPRARGGSKEGRHGHRD